MKGAIFDLDGTLVDSNDLHVQAWQETFRHFGKEFPAAELRQQIGKGGDQYLPVFLTERELREIGPEVEKFRGTLFKEKYLERVRPFPEVRELFERVRGAGTRIALASSGNEHEIVHYVKLLEVGDLIEAQTTKSDVQHSKPAPDVFLRALNLLQLSPPDAIAIGDTPYDVVAAKKIELRTIGFLCGGFMEDELRAAGAIAIYRDPANLRASYLRSPMSGPG
ncbi:MAG TPA: HAD family hydrolase [Chthoniobacterales bacterium]|nr:HAD family hydrolase [Chthoniobacterales bacterium]